MAKVNQIVSQATPTYQAENLNQFAREIMGETEKPVAESVEKQEEVRIFNKDCGCDKT